MSENKKPFLQLYVEQLSEELKLLDPNLTNDEIKKLVMHSLNGKIKPEDNFKFKLQNSYTYEHVEIDMDNLINTFTSSDCIITGTGTLYNNQNVITSITNDMITEFIDDRNISKKKLSESYAQNDMEKALKYDLEQLTLKILNNSLYGVRAEANSQFYNYFNAESITYTGVQAITLAITAFEMFLANSIKLENFTEVLRYINNIKKENYNILEYIDTPISSNDLYDYFIKKLIDFDLTELEQNSLKDIFDRLDENDINKLYYKNNLYKFIRNKKPLTLVKHIVDNYTVIDVYKDFDKDEDLLATMEKLWEMVDNAVAYKYMLFGRYRRALTMEREAVLVIDTDSNFISADYWYNTMVEELNIDENTMEDNYYFTLMNILIYMTSAYIKDSLYVFAKAGNVLDENIKYLSMDNEYLYKRLMTTRNKKQYVGLLSLDEGDIKNPPKIDMKGVSIKKVTVSSTTEEFFTDLITEDILKAKEIDLKNILNRYDDFSEYIRNSLKSGKMEFLTPVNVNNPDHYKFPFRIQGLRGIMAYNYIYSNNPIATPAKVKQLKIKGEKIEDLQVINGTPEYDLVLDKIFNNANPELAKYGFQIISLPITAEEIPSWLIPLIDYDTIINDNIKNGILFLESLGIQVINFRNKDYYTNVLKL